MNSRQAQLFRHILNTTGCPAAAARAVGLRDPAAKRKRPAPRDAPAAGEGGACDLERAVAALETEAVRRALSGVEVPVFHQGRECGSTVKHSDQLLMFLLKTLLPGRYGAAKEPAEAGQGRPVVLELDLSEAQEEDG